ncbi:hybrid sensor histidine kinase/response regulator transcription factor [Desertivirga xinjiangensis]|uniref:hybrid sensor histidine kinase/response regulator transcription factor n=1 Tax=Desertivirga xinjiangensis TaxID=539206 RepID=UPI00210DCB2D|nr:two-component regulator propeller domain-containing protein [Pedobacter xinjiangensis]
MARNRQALFVLSFLQVLFAFTSLKLKSQPITSSQLIFRHINQERGMSYGTVTCFAQDNKGFLWFGTKDGLNRYDGMEIKVFKKSSSGMTSNEVSALLADKEQLWIGHWGNGISIYDLKPDTFSRYQTASHSLSSNKVNAIVRDRNNTIWVATDKGINQFDRNKKKFTQWHFFNDSNTKEEVHAKCFFTDWQGKLWVGTWGKGLLEAIPGKKIFYKAKHIKQSESNTGAPPYITAISQLSDTQLLLCTRYNGLLTYNIQEKTYQNFFRNPSFQRFKSLKNFTAVIRDKESNIWVATDGDGLLRIKSQTDQIDQYLHNRFLNFSIANNALYSLFEDSEGNIYTGTYWRGVSVIDKSDTRVNFFPSDISGITPYPVLSILRDKSSLYIGTDGNGLTHYKISGGTLHKQVTVARNDYIQCITKDSKERIWAGTFKNGVMILDESDAVLKKLTHSSDRSKSSLSHNDVRGIIEAGDGDYLIGTWGGGLNRYNEHTEQVTSFQHLPGNRESISSNNITCMLAEPGKVWIGTFGGGLNLFEPAKNKFKRISLAQQVENILSIHKDKRNILWIGTQGNGLFSYNTRSAELRSYNNKNLRDNTIKAIREDHAGNIWLSTSDGIFKVDQTNGNVSNVNHLGARFNKEYHINSAFRDDHGVLYFGGTEGILCFNPLNTETPGNAPAVRITDFSLFNQKISPGPTSAINTSAAFNPEVKLNHDQNVITFDFAALSFPFSDKAEFLIRMDNFDENWRAIGTSRTATYTNLPPGNYKFNVKARLGNSNWSKESASVHLTIYKPLWATWWAYLCYLALLVLLLYLFSRNIVNWEKMKQNLEWEKLSKEKNAELHELKLRFFTNISHEIRTPVTLILGYIQELEESAIARKSALNTLSIIRKNGENLLRLVNELLDFRKLESKNFQLELQKENFMEFLSDICQSYQNTAKKKDISLSFNPDDVAADIYFDRKQMRKVVSNLISNSIKFTQTGGFIKIKLDRDEEYLYLTIEDNGRGIPKENLQDIFKPFHQNEVQDADSGFGLGLVIAQDIIKLHNGEILVESEPAKGTKFLIKLPAIRGFSYIPELSDESPISGEDSSGLPSLSVSTNIQTVLLIEDNEDIRQYLKKILQQDYQILEAGNGLSGFEVAVTALPDLIISDILMPEMNGISLTKKLKSDQRSSHIPVILLTARTSLDQKIEGYDSGADEYVTKPFNAALLKSRITNILQNRQVIYERIKNELITEPELITISSPDQKFLTQLVNILDEYIAEDVTIKLLTDKMGMSHSVIYKKIKALTGQSLVEFVRDHKLKAAVQLLKKNFQVSEVCYMIGFSDSRYFSKMFRQKFGELPSKYKQNQE